VRLTIAALEAFYAPTMAGVWSPLIDDMFTMEPNPCSARTEEIWNSKKRGLKLRQMEAKIEPAGQGRALSERFFTRTIRGRRATCGSEDGPRAKGTARPEKAPK
jgi:hypothetical protein